ncbi:MAG: hypothetical protein QOI83_3298 [Streptomycetaceae bacterium]|nr:hypothetical protein [Streptomycetaceae bacterium]
MVGQGSQKYPGASRKYWYQDDYGGDAMEVNTVVLHTTEGRTVPSYGGGSVAPNLTALPDLDARKLVWYQHFDIDISSRALANRPGGVETNTLNVCQVELVGTCDPKTHAEWGDAPHIYWPQAPEWALREVARYLVWMRQEHGVPLSGPKAWLPYPESAGSRNGQRMSGRAWNAFKGICGHQHVPENCVHPDTPILRADLTWVPAADLRVGEEIVSFDEETIAVGSTNGGRRYRRGVVTRNDPGLKDSYRVGTAGGEVVATADHPWLVRLPFANRGSRTAWVVSRDLVPLDHRIISVGRPWEPEGTGIAGRPAGAPDADGHAFAGGQDGSWADAGQVGGAVLDRGSCRSTGTLLPEQSGRPQWLLPAAERTWEGAVVGRTTGDVVVLGVEHIGEQPIASISTSTRTYIANGLLCHNSHGDPGAIDFAALLTYAKADVGVEDAGVDPG